MSEFCLIWNRNTELTCHPCYFYLNVRIHNRTGGKCGEAPTCQERVGLWCSQQKSQGAYDPVGWRGRWPQPQRATLSPYFSLCRLDHDQSKSTGGEKNTGRGKCGCAEAPCSIRSVVFHQMMEPSCVTFHLTPFISARPHGHIINSVWWVAWCWFAVQPHHFGHVLPCLQLLGNPVAVQACWRLDCFPVPTHATAK